MRATTYQYIITNEGGQNNNNSQPWYRADARSLQVQSSDPMAMSYVVDPAIFTTAATATDVHYAGLSKNYLIYQFHIGSFAGQNDGITVHAGHRDLRRHRKPSSTTSAAWDSMPLSRCRSRISDAM